jgi:CheY-specific phosphatase CheX
MSSLSQDVFFGLHLLNKGYINHTVLFKAANVQNKLNKKIGDIAIEYKYLTPAQVKEIYDEQKRKNSFFGEIAINKNLLNKTQVNEIIQKQKESHTFIGEIFQLLGYIEKDLLIKELEVFEKNDEKRLQKINQFVQETEKEFPFLDVLVNAASNTVFRMLLLSLKIESGVDKLSLPKTIDNMLKVDFTGDLNFSVYYNYDKIFSDDVVFNFFNTFPKKTVLSMKDSILSELTNIVSGVIATDLSNKRELSINISIPKVVQVKENAFEKEAIYIPLVSPTGKLEMYIEKK